MATFVPVHGGLGGRWEWTDVARELRGRGHEVFTPTLTGMGERHHLGPEVRLATHIHDIVSVLEFEELEDVVLTGHSYSGIVVTGAADRAAHSVGLVVSIDAELPEDGRSVVDRLPQVGEVVRSVADERGHGWVPVLDEVVPPEGLIDDERRSRYVARMRPQPVATFTAPVRLSGAIDRVPRGFARCTGGTIDLGSGDPIEGHAARAQAEGWAFRALSTPHDPQLFDPPGIAHVLDEMAAERPR